MMEEQCNMSITTGEISYLIWQISKYWQRGKLKVLDEFGITVSQLEVLGAIKHMTKEKEEVTQILLSQKTTIDPMTISTIIRNLERKGLINREESKTDTRARRVELTKEGNKIFNKAVTKVKKGQELLYANIDKEALKEQLTLLLNELNRINKKQ